jgi:hypothetical protein
MKGIVIKYGIISGLISALLLVGTSFFIDKIGFDNSMWVGYGGMFISFVPIYFSMTAFRDKVNNGQLTFGKALPIGLIVTAISAVFYVVAWIIVYHTMMPDFMDKYAAHQLAALKAQGAAAEVIAAKTKEFAEMKEAYNNPLSMFAFTYIEPLPVGILLSLIFALITRNKNGKPAYQYTALDTARKFEPVLIINHSLQV